MLIFQLVSHFHILELKYLDTLVIDATFTARLLNHSQISEPTGPAGAASACSMTQNPRTTQISQV